MTDNEIVKAFECCYLDKPCDKCPLYNGEYEICTSHSDDLPRKIVDLINRLQAEKEKLQNNISAMAITLSNSARATRHEAHKEFAERLKEKSEVCMVDDELKVVVTVNNIDDLLKEMVGEGNA